MRLAAALFVLSSLCLSTAAPALPAPPATHPAHDFYDTLNNLRLDPASVYQIKPIHHIISAAATPKFPSKKASSFSSLPSTAASTARSSPDADTSSLSPGKSPKNSSSPASSALPSSTRILPAPTSASPTPPPTDLLRQLQSVGLTQTDPSAATPWEPVIARLNPSHSLRSHVRIPDSSPQPYFYASLDGIATGPFDVLLDPLRSEPFLRPGPFRRTAPPVTMCGPLTIRPILVGAA